MKGWLLAALLCASSAPWAQGACEASCHVAQHEGWSGSLHARSWSEPLFQASYARARLRTWCRSCHAPTGRQPEAGVGCEVCHLRAGVILSASAPSAEALQAHPIRQDEALGTTVCGACHQFRQPVLDHPERETSIWAQHTLTEWRDTQSTKTCGECHFKTHASTGGHDLERLRGILTVELAPGEARLRVGNAGHLVPTGDPFRRLVFDACASADCATRLRRWTFGRTVRAAGEDLLEGQDTRLEPSSMRVLELPEGATHWRLELIFVEPGLEDRVPPESANVLISSGALLPR